MKIPNSRYLIIDLEATCADDGSLPREEMEIIEIGGVMLHAQSLEPESEFQTFVRPVRHPVLTDFCKELTKIRQSDVESAPSFAEAVDAMKRWMFQYEDPLFCSWGNYDRTQYLQDCEYHGVAYPFRSGHLNLKEEFSRAQNLRKRLGVAAALRRLGLQFEGTHHRAIDDARNIARIVRHVAGGEAAFAKDRDF